MDIQTEHHSSESRTTDDAVRILVLDDAPVVRRLIVRLCEEIDGVGAVLQAADAPSAMRLMEQQQPQIAVLDIKVPGGNGLRNGIDVLKAVKRTQPTVAVIMLTNHATQRYRRECEQAGATHFFDKSGEFEQLPIAVAALVDEIIHR
jgi:DNA-binding NarL/FixJ family response regulator